MNVAVTYINVVLNVYYSKHSTGDNEELVQHYKMTEMSTVESILTPPIININ